MFPFRWARRLLAAIGAEPAVAFVLGGNLVLAALSILQLALIVDRLTPAEQGVTFNFLASFQFQDLFEFGFGRVIQQLASHQRAFLTEAPAGTLVGDPARRARLGAILRLTVRYYALLAVAWCAVMLPSGWVFFTRVRGLGGLDWQLGWILTVLCGGLYLIANGMSKFLSGCADVNSVARVTTLQVVISAATSCAILAADGRLLAFPVSQLVSMVVFAVWFGVVRRRLLVDLWRARDPGAGVSWRHDIRPLQWRIGVATITSQTWLLMSHVAMYFYGAVVAGQLGLNMTIAYTVKIIGVNWVETRVPVFGGLIARKNWPELDRAYAQLLHRSTAFVAGLLGVMAVGQALLYYADIPVVRDWVARFLEPVPAALVGAIALAVHIYNARSAYLRAHVREPYLVVSVVQGVTLVGTMVLAGLYGDIRTLLAGYLFWTVVLGLGWGGRIFAAKRREWHADAAPVTAPAPPH